MKEIWFVSDLHGKLNRYSVLFQLLAKDPPSLLLMGGDLLPHDMARLPQGVEDFITGYLRPELLALKAELGPKYPQILLIPGNDDPAREEMSFTEMQEEGLIIFLSMRVLEIQGYTFIGYPYVPPTPFLRKDYEKYDVSRFADPGSVHPTEGYRTLAPPHDPEYSTIARDIEELSKNVDMDRSIWLMHSPPYQTRLDRAGLDGHTVDHVPLDVHVGSIAIRRFIEEKQPLITLHGHIHESSRITGAWQDSLGRTQMLSAAWDGPELALIHFHPEHPTNATRELLPTH
jgi:Icc-related predicted phosphoesterase